MEEIHTVKHWSSDLDFKLYSSELERAPLECFTRTLREHLEFEPTPVHELKLEFEALGG